MNFEIITSAILCKIIGEQSGWFWTMVQAIVVAISLPLIYRQLRAQRLANSLTALKAIDERCISSSIIKVAREEILCHRIRVQPCQQEGYWLGVQVPARPAGQARCVIATD